MDPNQTQVTQEQISTNNQKKKIPTKLNQTQMEKTLKNEKTRKTQIKKSKKDTICGRRRRSWSNGGHDRYFWIDLVEK